MVKWLKCQKKNEKYFQRVVQSIRTLQTRSLGEKKKTGIKTKRQQKFEQ